MVHLLSPSQYFLHSHKNQKHSSICAEALGRGLWQEGGNICGFGSHDVLYIKHNPTARPPSLQPFPYKSLNLYLLSLHTLVAVLSISQMVFIHRQKTRVFFCIICSTSADLWSASSVQAGESTTPTASFLPYSLGQDDISKCERK